MSKKKKKATKMLSVEEVYYSHACGCECVVCQQAMKDLEWYRHQVGCPCAECTEHQVGCSCAECTEDTDKDDPNDTEEYDFGDDAGEKDMSKNYYGGGSIWGNSSTSPATPYTPATTTYFSCNHDGNDPDLCFEYTLSKDKKIKFCGARTFAAVTPGSEYILYLPQNDSKAMKEDDSYSPIKSVTASLKEFKLEKLIYVPRFDQVVLDVKDQCAPRVLPSFWIAVMDIIRQREYDRVIPSCVGGHGRTGTALACLFLACYKATGTQAIRYIKNAYCSKAIESDEQKYYIKRIANVFNQMEEEGKLKRKPRPATPAKKVVESTTTHNKLHIKKCDVCGKTDTTVAADKDSFGKSFESCTPCYNKHMGLRDKFTFDSLQLLVKGKQSDGSASTSLPAVVTTVDTSKEAKIPSPTFWPADEDKFLPEVCWNCAKKDSTVRSTTVNLPLGASDKGDAVMYWECDECFAKADSKDTWTVDQILPTYDKAPVEVVVDDHLDLHIEVTTGGGFED